MLTGKTVSASSTAVDLLTGIEVDFSYTLQLRVTSGEVRFGDDGVTATSGMIWNSALGVLKVELNGERLFAILASGSGSGTVDLLAYSN
jgi:hypothetical protein